MTALCFACKAPTLTVSVLHARNVEIVLVDPEPDPEGTIAIRRWRGGYDGRRISGGADAPIGWWRHRAHSCKQPMEGPK